MRLKATELMIVEGNIHLLQYATKHDTYKWCSLYVNLNTSIS